MCSCLLAGLAIGVMCLAAPSVATATNSEDTVDIKYTRELFGINSGSASDAELEQILHSVEIGPSIRAQLACTYHGLHALDNTEADQTLANFAVNYINSLLDPKQVLEVALGELVGSSAALDAVSQSAETVYESKSTIQLFVGTLATLYSSSQYRELLSQYHGYEAVQGIDAAAAEAELRNEFAPVITSVAHARSLSEAQLFAQYEYSSRCVSFAEDGEALAAYSEFLTALVREMRQYETRGGLAGGGLMLIPISATTVAVANAGAAQISKVRILGADGHTVAAFAGSLSPGEAEALQLSAGTTSELSSVRFAVDGVEGIARTYPEVEGEYFVGAPFALPTSESQTIDFRLGAGPFTASGISGTYTWSFGDGGSSHEISPTHTYECPGTASATFEADFSNGHSVTQTLSASHPPPFNVDWTTAEHETFYGPNEEVTFEADPSIPEADPVEWDFGDGQTATGRIAKHAFGKTGGYNVTMKVRLPDPQCAPIAATHAVTVGQLDEWQPLPEHLGTRTLSAKVVGYYVYGNAIVDRGATVTIRAGANVKFLRGSEGLGMLWVKGGHLIVEGKPGAPAILTSPYDDSAGGHCSCVGSGTPGTGDWYGIKATDGGRIDLSDAAVRYAGVNLEGGSQTANISGSTITNAGTGLYSTSANSITVSGTTFERDNTGVVLEGAGSSYSPVFTGTVFSHDGQGVWARLGVAARFDHSTFTATSTAATLEAGGARTTFLHTDAEAPGNYIELYPGSTAVPAGSVALASDLPYVVIGDLVVPATSHLLVPAGAILKFASNTPSEAGQLTVRGSMDTTGTYGLPAVLTSIHDDTSGGHTAYGVTQAPQVGDWAGLALSGGASVRLDHAIVRYASRDVSLTSPGNALSTSESTLSNATDGLESGEGNTINAIATAFEHDAIGAALNGGTLAGAPSITDSTFRDNTKGIAASGGSNLQPVVHGSSFEAGEHAVSTTGATSVNASENWWGASSGPRPAGAGALVTGNVTTTPSCGNTRCIVASVSLAQSRLLADGHATTQATVSIARYGLPVWGDSVSLSASSPGTAVGSVHDNLDGSYTATITAPHATEQVTITATDTTAEPAATAQTTLEAVTPSISLHLSPSAILADGASHATATVSVTGPQGAAPNQLITLSGSDPGQTIGPVKDNGDGTYTAIVTASETIGSSTLTARDASTEPLPTATAALEQTSPAPDFGRCAKVSTGTGSYSNSSCTAPGGERKYRWLRATAPPPKSGFAVSLKMTSKVTLETHTSWRLTCTGLSGTGRYVGLKEVTSSPISFTGCANAASEPCTSAEAPVGQITTGELRGYLGVLRAQTPATKDKVGIVLTPGGPSAIASFRCGTTAAVLRGAVIAETTANAMSTTRNLVLAQTKGTQKWARFEGGPAATLELTVGARPPEAAGLALTAAQTSEEKVEINSAF